MLAEEVPLVHNKHGPKIRELMVKLDEYKKKVERLRGRIHLLSLKSLNYIWSDLLIIHIYHLDQITENFIQIISNLKQT